MSFLTDLDILPIIHLAIESPTHSIVDAALRSLPTILPVLDFSTIKNELFPVIASVFTKTSSLGIKVRGLEAFVILCGGSNDPAASNDGLNGIMSENSAKKNSSTALDKYTMQEKILPLIKGIKTKEPAVAVAALNVLRQVGTMADTEFVAMDILPVLWSMSLGPLLDLKQFQSFMELIKNLSTRVESEHTKKLQELSGTNGTKSKGNDDFMSFDAGNAFGATNGSSQDPEIDFERLVKGNTGAPTTSNAMDSGWDTVPVSPRPTVNQQKAPAFAWSTPSPTAATVVSPTMNAPLRPQPGPTSRTVTPDLSRFDTLSPSSTQFSQPLQPHNAFSTPLQSQGQPSYQAAPLQPQTQPSYQAAPLQPQPISSYQNQSSTINWASAAAPTSNPWASPGTSMNNLGNTMSNMTMNRPSMSNTSSSSFALPLPRPGMSNSSSFSLPPPPGVNANTFQSSFSPTPQSQSGIGFKPPPQQQGMGLGYGNGMQAQQPKKTGLDAFESLL
jgi:SCY1-like protein 2